MTPGRDAVCSALKEAAAFGTGRSINGATMYGRVPHVAHQAWFHIIYPGLDDLELAALGRTLGRPLPQSLAALLRWSNGLYLFSGALSVFGLRRSNVRSAEVREPFDLADPNVHGRPVPLAGNTFIVAFYKSDGSYVHLDGTSRVRRVARNDAHGRVLNEWRDLDSFLTAEVVRLAEHFDEVGQRLDLARSTAPDPDSQ